jgi:transposase
MMKLQDVLLKAMAKKITWWEAAEIIGVTDRTMRRWRERLEEHGAFRQTAETSCSHRWIMPTQTS